MRLKASPTGRTIPTCLYNKANKALDLYKDNLSSLRTILILIEYQKCRQNTQDYSYQKIWREIWSLVVPINNLYISWVTAVEIWEYAAHAAAAFNIRIDKSIKVMWEFTRGLVGT